jgi:hypothetical protein
VTEIKVEFAPGCFDEFTGTQEELDSLINEIMQLANSGKLFEESNIVNFDEISDDEEEHILSILEKSSRTLH